MHKFYIFLISLMIFSFSAFDIIPQKSTIPDLIPYRKGDKWGYCDINKSIKITPVFHSAQPFNCEKTFITLDFWYLIDKQGNLEKINHNLINYIFEFNENCLASFGIGTQRNQFGFPVGGRWGFLNTSNEMVIYPKYEAIGYFSESICSFNLEGQVNEFGRFEGGKWGFLDITGNVIIPAKYEDVREFSDGLAAVKFNSQWGFIDKNDNKKTLFIYEDIGSFSEGFAKVKFNNKWGFIDKNGNVMIEFKFDYVDDF